MIGLFVALAVALGIGGTAVVADNARPGDALFGVDQAMEQLRINIASKEHKDELRLQFAEERVKEIEDLEQEDSTDDTTTPDDTNDDSQDATDDTKKTLTDDEREHVSEGISSALTLLAGLGQDSGIDPARLAALTNILNTYLANLPEDAKIQVNDDKRLKIKVEDGSQSNREDAQDDVKDNNRKIKLETTTDTGRIRVEVKDGSIQIKSKLDTNKDDNDTSDDAHAGLGDIEAKIYKDKTVIEVEYNDEKTTFTTTATTHDEIIAAIIARFPTLTADQVGKALDLEQEDGKKDDQDEQEVEDSNQSDDNSSDENEQEDSGDNQGDDSGSDEGGEND